MSVSRRLAAILAADVAGYSRLMGADEEGTLERLKALRRELVDPKISAHHGRVVKTTGDGLLVEFPSVVDAVRCAVEVQQEMTERDTGVPADNRIELRIGINLGDVIIEGDDLFGDGVNIAARIEALADAGGVFVSNTVHDHVRDRLPFVFEDLGEQEMKNIARPVRVYRVRDATPAKSLSAPAQPVLPLPDKPSIAVLPFANMSGDSENRVRITAQLIDATNGAHLWADRFDGLLEEVFELQDKVAISVAGVIEPTLRQSEIERARRKRPDSLDAYDLYLRALPDAFAAMPEDADRALALLDKAVELEPDFAAAHAMIAWCHEQRYLRGGLQEETRKAALHHARQAIAAGGDDAAALATAGFVIAVAGRDFETALTAFDRSFALSSSSALALSFSSIVRAWKGDDAIAVEQANRALRLSPFDPWLYMPYIGLAYAHFAAGRFEETVAAASLAIQSNPRFSVPQILHAAALGSVDRSEDAKTVVQRLLELQPGLTVTTAILSARYANPENLVALGKALRQAGLPE